VVKKVGALKITHERYKSTRKALQPMIESFRSTFSTATSLQPDLKPHLAKAQEDMNPKRVLDLFRRIPDQDVECMGMDPVHGRPELFLWTAVPVPPVAIRPSVGQEASSNEDDLTVLLSDIVIVNTRLREIMRTGRDVKVLMEHWDFLQLQCGMLVNSDLPGVQNFPPMLNRIKRGLVQRLKGKQGRFRGNLSGKRVDFSARTVISPDPNLAIDQVAVPEQVAMIMTYPERVTAHNKEVLKRAVRNGVDRHPGAVYIKVAATGEKNFLKFGNRDAAAERLVEGDVVERHMRDGDVVLFNRQPSLHKLSIMSHFAKIRPWRTFRLNECVCTPYNADFDGDEMNLHLPQTEEARAEAMALMNVKHNLITPRNGEPLVAATQDFISGAYLLTRRDVFFDRAWICQWLCGMGDALLHIDLPPPAILKPRALWTGRQLFSALIRPNRTSPVIINLETRTRNYDKGTKVPEMDVNDGYLVIRNSEIMCGVIDKSVIGGESKNGIFYAIMRDYGVAQAAGCMNRLAKMCARFLGNRGFSIGIDDVQPGLVLSRRKEEVVAKGYADTDELIMKSQRGELENLPGCNETQTLENKISGVLSKIRDDVGGICLAELHRHNAPIIMSLCGSKGSKINVSQMVACVGQQIISGSRIPNGFMDRSLPHFPKNSRTPAARGFVRNSFYSGLTPSEFLFHAVSGREGLVDTAVKTAETGYMQRRLMKALEDLVSHYDTSVRNSVGGMIQFRYGDDGLDPANMEGDKQPVNLNRLLLHCQAIVSSEGKRPLLPWEIRKTFVDMLGSDRFVSECGAHFIEEVKAFVEGKIVKKLAAIRRRFDANEGLVDGQADEIRDPIIRAAVDNSLKFTEDQCTLFLETCLRKYSRAKMEAATAVGAVGAQSIGEPGTQMTLKTFHFAGVASMNVTLGVPRIKEIINASKQINTPIISAELLNKTDEKVARIVKGRVEKTTLEDIAEFVEEVIKKDDTYLTIKLDTDAIEKLQLEVDLRSVADAIERAPRLKKGQLTVHTVAPNRIDVLLPDRADTPTSKASATPPPGIINRLHALKRALPKIIIKGIPTVNRAVINEEKDKTYKLLVEGYGLRHVMNTEGVRGVNVTSNHVMEVLSVLGIEAARQTIIKEIIDVMGSHGMTIDPRHVMLLADLMTNKGEVLGITRFGIAKMKDSVLMLASFEKTTDHLFEASFYGKKDSINGVSECIIMGVPMSIGTGLFKLQQIRGGQDRGRLDVLTGVDDFNMEPHDSRSAGESEKSDIQGWSRKLASDDKLKSPFVGNRHLKDLKANRSRAVECRYDRETRKRGPPKGFPRKRRSKIEVGGDTPVPKIAVADSPRQDILSLMDSKTNLLSKISDSDNRVATEPLSSTFHAEMRFNAVSNVHLNVNIGDYSDSMKPGTPRNGLGVLSHRRGGTLEDHRSENAPSPDSHPSAFSSVAHVTPTFAYPTWHRNTTGFLGAVQDPLFDAYKLNQIPLPRELSIFDDFPPLPSEDVILSLVYFYFATCHHLSPILHRASFLINLTKQPPILLYSILIVAASYQTDPSLKHHSSSLWKRARRIALLCSEAQPTLPVCVVRMARSLRLNEEPCDGVLAEIGSSKWIEQETGRRLWYFIYQSDRATAIVFNPIMYTSDEETTVALPISDDIWEADSLPDLLVPASRTFLSKPGRSTSSFFRLITMMGIFARIVDFRRYCAYRNTDHWRVPHDPEISSQLCAINAELTEWKRDLVPHFLNMEHILATLGSNSSSSHSRDFAFFQLEAKHTATLWIIHSSAYVLLHMPQDMQSAAEKPDPAWLTSASYMVCQEHASLVTVGLELLMRLDPELQTIPFAQWSIFNIAIIYFLSIKNLTAHAQQSSNLHGGHQDPVTNHKVLGFVDAMLQQIHLHLHALSVFGRVWQTGQMAVKFIERILSSARTRSSSRIIDREGSKLDSTQTVDQELAEDGVNLPSGRSPNMDLPGSLISTDSPSSSTSCGTLNVKELPPDTLNIFKADTDIASFWEEPPI
ncbi:hypothetical protein HDU93_003104, partial [Gonapodya sp. JEL0774]